MNIDALKSANAARWRVMHVRSEMGRELDTYAERLTNELAKARYEDVSE